MNWKFYIATMAIVIIAGGYMVINEQSKKLNRLNNANKELASRLEELVNINHDYQKRVTLLNQLDIKHTQELVNAKKKLMSCVFWLSVILSGCISEPSAPPVSPQILPPAWMMQSPPDLLTPLSEIIGYLENELPSRKE